MLNDINVSIGPFVDYSETQGSFLYDVGILNES